MDTNFDQIDFGPLKPYLEDDDITDISYDNDGQIHLKTLSKGIFRIENPEINNTFMEKLAFQCSNVMGKTFNMAHPFLDAESAELRLAFIHESVSRNGIACVLRKTPAKIRLQKEKIVADKYVELDIVEFLEQCVLGHCNIIVSGETGSGKTELVKYLASKIAENEKIITIEDTLELHLDRIFPHRDIVSMKTNNIASYTDILEACMRQNPKWILLSEVRSAEAVLAVRNSISSGHYILSTIHADKAASIPNRLYSLLETNQDIDQFMSSICRYIQLGIYVRGYTDKATHSFKREIAEVTEFYVDSNTNKSGHNIIYRKGADGKVIRNNPSPYLIDYLEVQGVFLPKELQYMAGEATNESTAPIETPLSEADISDNQTVIFSSEGAKIEEKSMESVSNGLNPIETATNASEFSGSVSEVPNVVQENVQPVVEPANIDNNIYTGPSAPEPVIPNPALETVQPVVEQTNIDNNIYAAPSTADPVIPNMASETVQPVVEPANIDNSIYTAPSAPDPVIPNSASETVQPVVEPTGIDNNIYASDVSQESTIPDQNILEKKIDNLFE